MVEYRQGHAAFVLTKEVRLSQRAVVNHGEQRSVELRRAPLFAGGSSFYVVTICYSVSARLLSASSYFACICRSSLMTVIERNMPRPAWVQSKSFLGSISANV